MADGPEQMPEPAVASSNRFADLAPYVYRLFKEDPHTWQEVFPWEFPQHGSKQDEEAFIRRFFDDREIRMQGGTEPPGAGFRFLKQVWYTIAIYNFEQRVPLVADWWLRNNEDLLGDPKMREHFFKPDVQPSTFFGPEELSLYAIKFLEVTIRCIQHRLRESSKESEAPKATQSTGPPIPPISDEPTPKAARISSSASRKTDTTSSEQERARSADDVRTLHATDSGAQVPGRPDTPDLPLLRVSQSMPARGQVSGCSFDGDVDSRSGTAQSSSLSSGSPKPRGQQGVSASHGGKPPITHHRDGLLNVTNQSQTSDVTPTQGAAYRFSTRNRAKSGITIPRPSEFMPTNPHDYTLAGGPMHHLMGYPHYVPNGLYRPSDPPAIFNPDTGALDPVQTDAHWTMQSSGTGTYYPSERHPFTDPSLPLESEINGHGGNSRNAPGQRGGRARGNSGGYRGRGGKGRNSFSRSSGLPPGPSQIHDFNQVDNYYPMSHYDGRAQNHRFGIAQYGYRRSSDHWPQPRDLASARPAPKPHSLQTEEIDPRRVGREERPPYHLFDRHTIPEGCTHATKLLTFDVPVDFPDQEIHAFFSQFGRVNRIARSLPRGQSANTTLVFIHFSDVSGARECLRHNGMPWAKGILRVEVPREFWDPDFSLHRTYPPRSSSSSIPSNTHSLMSHGPADYQAGPGPGPARRREIAVGGDPRAPWQQNTKSLSIHSEGTKSAALSSTPKGKKKGKTPKTTSTKAQEPLAEQSKNITAPIIVDGPNERPASRRDTPLYEQPKDEVDQYQLKEEQKVELTVPIIDVSNKDAPLRSATVTPDETSNDTLNATMEDVTPHVPSDLSDVLKDTTEIPSGSDLSMEPTETGLLRTDIPEVENALNPERPAVDAQAPGSVDFRDVHDEANNDQCNIHEEMHDIDGNPEETSGKDVEQTLQKTVPEETQDINSCSTVTDASAEEERAKSIDEAVDKTPQPAALPQSLDSVGHSEEVDTMSVSAPPPKDEEQLPVVYSSPTPLGLARTKSSEVGSPGTQAALQTPEDKSNPAQTSKVSRAKGPAQTESFSQFAKSVRRKKNKPVKAKCIVKGDSTMTTAKVDAVEQSCQTPEETSGLSGDRSASDQYLSCRESFLSERSESKQEVFLAVQSKESPQSEEQSHVVETQQPSPKRRAQGLGKILTGLFGGQPVEASIADRVLPGPASEHSDTAELMSQPDRTTPDTPTLFVSAATTPIQDISHNPQVGSVAKESPGTANTARSEAELAQKLFAIDVASVDHFHGTFASSEPPNASTGQVQVPQGLGISDVSYPAMVVEPAAKRKKKKHRKSGKTAAKDSVADSMSGTGSDKASSSTYEFQGNDAASDASSRTLDSPVASSPAREILKLRGKGPPHLIEAPAPRNRNRRLASGRSSGANTPCEERSPSDSQVGPREASGEDGAQPKNGFVLIIAANSKTDVPGVVKITFSRNDDDDEPPGDVEAADGARGTVGRVVEELADESGQDEEQESMEVRLSREKLARLSEAERFHKMAARQRSESGQSMDSGQQTG